MLVCPGCETSFLKNGPNQKWCSMKCRKATYARDMKAALRAVVVVCKCGCGRTYNRGVSQRRGYFSRQCSIDVWERKKSTDEMRAYMKDASLRSKYGVSQVDVDAMHDEQNGECALCSKPRLGRHRNGLHIDHDHVSGRVRGLLCVRCNAAIGVLGDDEEVLARAIRYLRGEGEFSRHGRPGRAGLRAMRSA